jgi:hypothetical protein
MVLLAPTIFHEVRRGPEAPHFGHAGPTEAEEASLITATDNQLPNGERAQASADPQPDDDEDLELRLHACEDYPILRRSMI